MHALLDGVWVLWHVPAVAAPLHLSTLCAAPACGQVRRRADSTGQNKRCDDDEGGVYRILLRLHCCLHYQHTAVVTALHQPESYSRLQTSHTFQCPPRVVVCIRGRCIGLLSEDQQFTITNGYSFTFDGDQRIMNLIQFRYSQMRIFFITSTQNGFKRTMHKYGEEVVYKKVMDRIQIDFECCGNVNFKDWMEVLWVDNEGKVKVSVFFNN